MNNYCSNCGNEIKKYSSICKKCNTPVLDIPYDYKHLDKRIRKRNKKVLTVIILISFIFVIYIITRFIYVKYMSSKLKDEYVIPYLNEVYGEYYHDLEFDMYGKCIISGNCYTEPFMECDGNGCILYEYLSRFKCMSFFYKFKITYEGIPKELTIYRMNGKFNVVEGRKIYNDDYPVEFFVKNVPYESDFIQTNEEFSYFYRLKDTVSFWVDFNEENNNLLKIYSSDFISFLNIKIKSYDENKNEIDSYELSEMIDSYGVKINPGTEKYIKIFIGDNNE